MIKPDRELSDSEIAEYKALANKLRRQLDEPLELIQEATFVASSTAITALAPYAAQRPMAENTALLLAFIAEILKAIIKAREALANSPLIPEAHPAWNDVFRHNRDNDAQSATAE